MTHEVYEYAMLAILTVIFVLTIVSCWVDYKKIHRGEE